MENTNLVLSEEERSMVKNASLILTKNRIIQKVYEIFGQMANEDRSRWHFLPMLNAQREPKISKGENLLGLPWVMLDHPRYFTNHDILAIRILFWWGHYFSITLHVKGVYKKLTSALILDQLQGFRETDWCVGTGDDPWDHNHQQGIYEPMVGLPSNEITNLINTKDHFRISKTYSFDKWDEVQNSLKQDRNMLFELISACIGDNRNKTEKD